MVDGTGGPSGFAGQGVGWPPLSHDVGDPQNILDRFGGSGLRHAAIPVPGGKLVGGFHESFGGPWFNLGHGRSRGPVLLQEPGRFSHQVQRFARRLQYKSGQEIPATAGVPDGRDPSQPLGASIPSEPRGKPSLQQILIGEFGRRRINNGRAWIQSGFHRVGPDQLLTESVDGRAGDFIQVLRFEFQTLLLRLGEPRWQCRGELDGNRARQEVSHHRLDPLQKLGRRRLREGDGDDLPGVNTCADHQGDATGQESGLSASGTGLHQEGALMVGQGRDAGCGIGEQSHRFVVGHSNKP